MKKFISTLLASTLILSTLTTCFATENSAEEGIKKPTVQVSTPNITLPENITPNVSLPENITPDIATPDIATPDIATPDIATPDIATPDIATPDIATPDIATPDIATPDIATPDIATPDIATPDIAIPDMVTPDIAIPDMVTPDIAIPDMVTPDIAIPDMVTPDITTPDIVIPEITKPEIPEWAKPYIEFVGPNIMPDISEENFDEDSSRGLIAQSIYNMVSDGEIATTSHNFTDEGDYDEAIAWCNENNVMKGVSETSFGTEENVTREQFALILRKVAENMEKDMEYDPEVLSDFEDSENISSWASEGMAWAVSNNLMSGNANQLNPSDPITRTEVAVMLLAFDSL